MKTTTNNNNAVTVRSVINTKTIPEVVRYAHCVARLMGTELGLTNIRVSVS